MLKTHKVIDQLFHDVLGYFAPDMPRLGQGRAVIRVNANNYIEFCIIDVTEEDEMDMRYGSLQE